MLLNISWIPILILPRCFHNFFCIPASILHISSDAKFPPQMPGELYHPETSNVNSFGNINECCIYILKDVADISTILPSPKSASLCVRETLVLPNTFHPFVNVKG